MDRTHHRQLSVLVGDDDEAVLACVVELLVAEGFEVHPAHCGRESLHILLSMPIDLSILDVHMPDMTGIEVMERYLAGPLIAAPSTAPKRERARRVPAIFMSGEATDEIRTRCDRGGWGLLDKPFAPADMRGAVRRVLQSLNF